MNLKDVREALLQELGDSATISFINTRLILATGVDLYQEEEPETGQMERLLVALREMGYSAGEK